KKVEWIDIDFKGLIPALQAGRADIAVSAIYITPRKRSAPSPTPPSRRWSSSRTASAPALTSNWSRRWPARWARRSSGSTSTSRG
ncbi:hypothetical protein CTI14_58390, partial [Methylobacterium radiotolerans]